MKVSTFRTNERQLLSPVPPPAACLLIAALNVRSPLKNARLNGAGSALVYVTIVLVYVIARAWLSL